MDSNSNRITTLEKIPFAPDLPGLLKKLHLRPETHNAAELGVMVQEAHALARPKAAYRAAFVEACREDQVLIDGMTFTSHILSTNLESVHRVYPYVATCGLELDTWSHSFTDMLARFWADAIAESALHQARKFLENHLTELYLPSETELSPDRKAPRFVKMNPGSLQDWPLSEQKPLFGLMGDVSGTIGVTLSDTCLMHPIKSASGIIFANMEGYANCQLCPREGCPGRQAPYDPDLFEAKYARVTSR